MASLRVSREAFKDVVQAQSGSTTEVVRDDRDNAEEEVQQTRTKSNLLTPVEQVGLEKLNNSNCLNFVSHSYRNYYKHTTSANSYSEIIEKCSELKKEFDSGLDEADKKMIDDIFF